MRDFFRRRAINENDFGKLTSPAAALQAGYRFTPVWGLRFGLSGWQGKGSWVAPRTDYDFNYLQLGADAVVDLGNWIGGFNYRRFWNPYLFAGVGGAVGFNNDGAQALADAGNDLPYLWDGSRFFGVGRMGLGMDFRICEAVAFNLEGNANVLSDHFNSKKAGNADWQFNLLNANLKDFVYPRRHTGLLAAATALNFRHIKLQASLLGTFVSDRLREKGDAASDRMEWTPAVVMSYRPFERIGLDFRAFYKRIFRMPTLNDLYYTFIGNARLDPEYTDQYNLGVTYEKQFPALWLKRVELQADVYYNEVENKIVATPTSNFFRWTMVNLGKVEIRGVDVALQTDWILGRETNLSGRLNYTYQKAQDFTDPTDEFYGGQIPYIPWHSGSTAISLSWRSWEASYSFIYTGERYSSQANLPANYQPSWYTSDCSISKSQHINKHELKLTLEANNLLNQQYEVVSCYPMPGINFRLIVQYMF